MLARRRLASSTLALHTNYRLGWGSGGGQERCGAFQARSLRATLLIRGTSNLSIAILLFPIHNRIKETSTLGYRTI
jgi:hypothetical protein